jgi:hypothetical protein
VAAESVEFSSFPALTRSLGNIHTPGCPPTRLVQISPHSLHPPVHGEISTKSLATRLCRYFLIPFTNPIMGKYPHGRRAECSSFSELTCLYRGFCTVGLCRYLLIPMAKYPQSRWQLDCADISSFRSPTRSWVNIRTVGVQNVPHFLNSPVYTEVSAPSACAEISSAPARGKVHTLGPQGETFNCADISLFLRISILSSVVTSMIPCSKWFCSRGC